MSIILKFQNEEFKALQDLKLQSPKANIKIGDELKNVNDILISRYDTLINIKYLKDHDSNHIIGTSPAIEEEIKSIIAFENNASNNLSSRISPIIENKIVIEDESQFDNKYLKLVDNFDFSSYHESIDSKLKLITNELYTNDIFHRLNNQKYGEISFSQDSNKIIIYYKSYTNIEKSAILDSLYRAAKDRTPRQDGRGAGLGLYMILQNCDQFQIVENKNDTSFYIYLERNKRYKEISKRIPSISFYKLKE